MNPSTTKCPMPEQSPDLRIRNFDEVALGYTPEMAICEAERCLNCKVPHCVKGCPVNIDIPGFLMQITDGDFAGALARIKNTNALPGICGRVCPQERQCEALCVRGAKGEPVAIGRLERFVADRQRPAVSGGATDISHATPLHATPLRGKKVAVLGSGPAGLSCAADLAALGYRVTIFEAFHTPGGVLVYGIPAFRLPKEVVAHEIEALVAQGVELCTNTIVGKSLSIDDLFDDGYAAIFVGTGAGLPQFMNIPGETLPGVFSANEFLTRINLMKGYLDYDTPVERKGKFVVVGGGNVAMDAARCAKRMGAESVTVIYRRSEAEMPARAEELHHAKEEGVSFMLLTGPVQILGNEAGQVRAVLCERMELGAPDAHGRRTPHPIADSQAEVAADVVIMALGTSPNPLVLSTTPGLDADARGRLQVDENSMTSRPGVFAGGDAVTGAATVILAMGAGKRAARGIHAWLTETPT